MTRPKKLPAPLLILLLALAFALLIFALGHLRLAFFADWLSGLFGRDGDHSANAGDAHYEALLDQLRQPGAEPVPLDALTLTEAFAHYAFELNYRHVYTVSYADGGRSADYTAELARQEDQYRLTIYRGTQAQEDAVLYLADLDGSAFQTVDGMDNRHLYPAGEDFPYFSVVMQPNPDAIIEMLREYERSPDTAALSACTVTLELTERGRRLTVRCTERDTGRTGEYAYLLDYGILESAAVTENGVVWYTLTTRSVSSSVEISGEV